MGGAARVRGPRPYHGCQIKNISVSPMVTEKGRERDRKRQAAAGVGTQHRPSLAARADAEPCGAGERGTRDVASLTCDQHACYVTPVASVAVLISLSFLLLPGEDGGAFRLRSRLLFICVRGTN
jgi:hypothetical protein